MATSWLTQDFGDNDEESDTEFNPSGEVGSDNEEDERATRPANNIDERPPPENPKPRKRLNEIEDEEGVKATNGEENDEANGGDNEENAEGGGEDLNGGDDDEEEDEEDEEDEDEDDEAITTRPRKRRRRRLNQFFEEEAEVDEDDDELDVEDDEGVEGFVEETHPDDELPPEADQDDRRHRELDRQRQMEASLDAEKQAEKFRERYGRRTARDLGNASFVPQNLLMPDVNDQSIWGVKCKPGKEKEIVSRLLKRIEDSFKTRKPMKICSVFERGNGPMTGYIWVEARRKMDVEEALNGVADVYPHSKTTLVPVKDMPDLLRVNKSKELKVGEYVRIRRGLYQGDLGQIENVESNGLTVNVRLVPRLTYGLDEDDQNRPSLPGGEKRKRPIGFAANNPANRPPQRLFNENEAKKRHSRFLTSNRNLTRNSFVYRNEEYEDGFLLKDFRLQHLSTDNVNPRLDEITKLTRTAEDGSELLDLETLAHSLRNTTAEGSYMPGDEVEVYEGEQRGIVGRTEGVTGNIVSIKVTQGDLLGEVVEVPVKGLRKRFKEGDHVRVIGGSRYNGEVGMVNLIKGDRVTILTDTSMQEITVFSKDLREATGEGGTVADGIKFDVQELVQVDPTTAGVVIKSDKESVRILDQNGSITTRLPTQIQPIEARRNAVATDKNGSEIRPGDVVRESAGEGKTGTILHLHRGFIFAHNKTQIENSGLWVARCSNVVTTAAKGGRITAPTTDLSKMNPALQMRNGQGAMAPPRAGPDRLIKKRVKITRGPYKGHRGLVKDTTSEVARIELESKNKTVNVEKDHLSIIDHISNKETPYREFVTQRGPPRMSAGPGASGSRVPDWSGGRTPMAVADGGRTPAWGSAARTPAWTGAGGSLDSGRTPAWKPAGGATAYGGAGNTTTYGGAGNTTTYGGAGNYGASGSRTPAWSSSAKTPYGADHGFSSNSGSSFDAFAAGSRTPAYGSTNNSSRTPAWGGSGASAPTPARAYDAPTPAATAPTPGAWGDDAYTPYGGAPTPAFGTKANMEPIKNNRWDAPTPGASAPTPFVGGYDAPTPAAGGPRYAEDDDDDAPGGGW